MGIIKIRPEHVIKDVPFVTFLRQELRDPDLIMVHAQSNNTWFLAHWVDKVSGFINCIENLGVNYQERCTREFVQSLRRARNPQKAGEMKKNILKAHNREMEQEDEKLAQTNEHWNWLKKRTANYAPVPYSFTSKVK